MVFNFGAFDQGVAQSNKEFKAKRAENAALYSDFLRSNPDATVEERELFADNLAGNSNFLKNALPSREMMERNVSRRKQQQAAAAQARKRAALKDNIAMANTLSTVYGNAYLSGGEEAAMSAVQELAGGVLPDAAMPLVQQFGVEKAQAKFNKQFEPKYSVWKTAGANPDDIKSWEASLPESARSLVSPWVQQAEAEIEGARRSQKLTALNAATDIINTGDEVQVDNFVRDLEVKFPRTTPEDRVDIAETTRQGFQGYQDRKNQRVESLVDSAVNLSVNKFGAGQNLSVDAAISEIELEARKVDPSYEITPDVVARLESARDQRLEVVNRTANVEEDRAIIAEAQDYLQGYTSFDPSEFDDNAILAAEGHLVDMGEKDVDAKGFAGSAVNDVADLAITYGLPVNQGRVAESFVLGLMDKAKNAKTAEISTLNKSEKFAVYDNVMKAQSGMDGQAYRRVLQSVGVNTLNEFVEAMKDRGGAGAFRPFYEEAVRSLTEGAKDILEEGVYTPELVKDAIENDVDGAKGALKILSEPAEDGMNLAERTQAVLDMTPAPETLPDIASGILSSEKGLRSAAATVEQQIVKLSDRMRRAELQLNLPQMNMPEFGQERSLAVQTLGQLEDQIAQLNTAREEIAAQRRKVAAQKKKAITGTASLDFDAMEALASMIAISVNEGGNQRELIKAAIPESMEELTNPRLYRRELGFFVDRYLRHLNVFSKGGLSPEQENQRLIDEEENQILRELLVRLQQAGRR